MAGGAVLDAVLERITYANDETGYTVARVAPPDGAELLTVVGALLGAQPGESLRLTGRWSTHPKFGRQFEVFSYETVLPATVQGIRRYLGSGLIKGVGPKLAERIVDAFGADALEVIESAPDRLGEVHGLGAKRVAAIKVAWQEQRAIKEVMVFLQGVGVSTSLAVRIFKTYGDDSVKVVREEPYRLAAEVFGIGFKTADTIAQAVGIPHDSPQRVRAGLAYALSEAADDGHCFLPEPKLVVSARRILDVDPVLVRECLDDLVAADGAVREEVPGTDADGQPTSVRAVYLPAFHRAEISLANGLLRLLHSDSDRLAAFSTVDWERALRWLRERTGAELAEQQRDAVRLALTERLSILTGGPGCGKSFTVASVVALALARKAKVLLVAPTGRAAKRLSELAGHDAATIHRLLQLRPGGDAAYDRDNPLDADLIVVDEVSMVDLLLANRLVKAVADGAHLLLVGDPDQLPSVGAGEVLRDLLAAEAVPRVRLTEVFRAAARSGVVSNAHRINQGLPPVTTGLPDFFLFPCEDTEPTAELVVDVVARRMPARFGLDARRDIQVLAPMHRGPAGAGNLNALLQEALTPGADSRPERRQGGRVFRLGDKVIQLRNNYDKNVFNGTVGRIVGLSTEEQSVTVVTDEDSTVDYEFAELDELAHAYAVTIHRSQGSEYPAVVVPVPVGAWQMLHRNLLYTAITRARKLVVLVGSRRALAHAVRSRGAGHRHTTLAHRLRTVAAPA
jgi:exodeoxyribonuclease V alpha subunit